MGRRRRGGIYLGEGMAVGLEGRFGVEGPLTSTPPPEKRCLGVIVVGTGLNLSGQTQLPDCILPLLDTFGGSLLRVPVHALSQGSQVLCLAPKSFHFIKYHSFWFIILMSRISSTTHSSSPSMISGSGGTPSDNGVQWCHCQFDHVKDLVKPLW